MNNNSSLIETIKIISKSNYSVLDLNSNNPIEYFDSKEFHEYHSKFSDKLLLFKYVLAGFEIMYFYVGISDHKASAPYSSPFSNLITKFKVDEDLVYDFFNKVILELRNLNVNNFKITLPPEFYNPNLIATLSKSLNKIGFTEAYSDINSHIELTFFSDLNEFISGCKASLRKKYKQAIRNELLFVESEKQYYSEVYEVIKTNREQKKFPLRISYSQFEDMINLGFLNIRCFQIERKSKIIAACITIEFNSENAFVLYWGDLIDYRSFSPMSLLTISVINYYKQEKFKQVDLGPSSSAGVINQGLFDFKQTLNSISTLKRTFYIDLQ